MRTIRVIHPASRALDDTLTDKIKQLKNSLSGFDVSCQIPEGDPGKFWLAHTPEKRLTELREALFSETLDIIFCGRGGYGMSDLLDDIAWADLTFIKPKIVCGFSDISALLAKIHRELGWPAIHGPMINTDKWQELCQQDLQTLIELLQSQSQTVSLNIVSASHPEKVARGPLYGGCLSVLTNLIGTQHFAKDLSGHILFFEDVAEPVPRVIRNLQQWRQCGYFGQCEAIILGSFVKSSLESASEMAQFAGELAELSGKPVFVSSQFGHGPINIPIQLGAQAVVHSKSFTWHWEFQ